jgi:dihydroorotate dehydrogenase (fumarate)
MTSSADATATTSVDLSTRYLGLALPHPFMPGASPMVDDLDLVRRLEDAGAAAIVMHSLFEEQIEMEQGRTRYDIDSHLNAYSEASSFFPRPAEFKLGPQAYLEQIRRIKEAVKVPVIASLNGVTATGWLDYAKLIEQAGADALELNVYYVATDAGEDGAAVERRTIDIVRTVKQAIRIPIAVKLSSFFSSLSHFAAGWRRRCRRPGAFNRSPADIEALEAATNCTSGPRSSAALRYWRSLGTTETDLRSAASIRQPTPSRRSWRGRGRCRLCRRC